MLATEHLITNGSQPFEVFDSAYTRLVFRVADWLGSASAKDGDSELSPTHAPSDYWTFLISASRHDRFNNCLVVFLGLNVPWRGNTLVIAHCEDGQVVDWQETWNDMLRQVLLRFLQTTPAEVAVSALQANHELGHCTHVHGEMTANRGSPGFMPLQVMSEIISWTNFTTLTAFSKTNPLLHREVNKIIKSRVKDVLAHFFARTQLPDFFHRLAIAEAYVFGDVALNIVLAENWGCREMQIAVARDRAGPFIHWLSHRAGYHNTDIVGERKGCRRSVRLFNAQIGRTIFVHESATNLALSTILAASVSADMTLFTGTAIYSLYSDIHEGRQILADDLETDSHYNNVDMEPRVDGSRSKDVTFCYGEG
ncbi:hypothetical protein EYR40_007447 [Pleurotus pulmonarius]|nr:hypothetical protein EYR36_002256 [Pleurotus pulmonarius]KAF4583762.1 hypothetical protein EYR40_002253 [Pleurotus pulmonarius]KAF4596862.1 hypothetical protein EYR38_008253 [Pleurotus pulmonarius]KAF4596997.1 hypothetical protein EYR40_007447 [Pleurotus pulmonarius]